jgi:plasmid replication initiation protein
MENKLVVQSNALTSSRFEYSVLERNLFYSVLKQLKKEPKTKYVISTLDLHKDTGVENNYENYKVATANMIGRVYEFEKENGNLLQVSMFTSAEYIKGAGLIEIELSEKLHPYLFDLKSNFTLFQLDVALGLSSKFGKRMYEILSQWKTFNDGVKTFELLELKTMLNLYNPKTGVEQYKNWTDFERRVLKVAQKDLNRKDISSDITFTYTAEKRGRKYISVTFHIKSKSFQKMMDFTDVKAERWVVLVNEFSLNKGQAEYVLENYEESELNKIIYEIRVDIKGGKVKKSVGGYCAKRFGVVGK